MEEYLIELVKHWSYWGVAAFLWGTGFGCPLPEDVCLLIAGWLCGIGEAKLALMIPLTMFCVLGSDVVIYFMGWHWGRQVATWWPFRLFLSEEKLLKAESLFHEHGGKTLFAVRFMPLVRAPSFFTAGTFKYPFLKFLFYDGIAALASVPVLVLLGYYFSDQFEAVQKWSRQGQIVLAVVVVLAIVAYVWWIRRRRRMRPEADGGAKAGGARNTSPSAAE